jgi:hypothetical protein
MEGGNALVCIPFRPWDKPLHWRHIMLEYKVVEITSVAEDTLEEALNEWSSKGWRFDGMQFAMRESSRRPGMAFLLFTRDNSLEDE